MFSVVVSRRRLLKGALLCALGLAIALLTRTRPPAGLPANAPGVLVQSPQVVAVNMLRQRCEALLDGDLERIRPNYLVGDLGGEYAWVKEKERTAYFRSWLEARSVTLTSASSWFEVDSVSSFGGGAYRLEITEHATYAYSPAGTTSPVHTFGSRTVHVMEVKLTDGGWRIVYDWYIDPLGDGALKPAPGRISASSADPPAGTGGSQRFNRAKAAAYALRYAGVRSLPGGGKYNRSYQVYSYVGGDCANFASQVLYAGGLSQDYGWGYSRGGSVSWTCSQDLLWYLLGSGAGQRVYRGAFAGALLPLPDEPRGAIGLLEPGDVIGYDTGDGVSHVAVVAGIDPSGWPVIASHTADRLYFPWDLGWDDDTVFWFVHVVY